MTLYESQALKERYFRFAHKSGLDIYVFPKKLSTTYALFGTRYGSIDNCFRLEGESELTVVPPGIAHYLEHRMFTQPSGEDITERFSSLGADCNAYTTYTKTVYLFSATENAEEALTALVELVTRPYFTGALVKKERGIITEEIRMEEDNPYSRCFERLLMALYHKHSVREPVAGTVSSVKKITAELLSRCYDAFYSPGNMALVVCGDISPERVAELVEDAIPESFCQKNVIRSYEKEPPSVRKAVIECEMPVSKPIFQIGIKDTHIPITAEARMRRYAAMSILCDAVFSRSGELYNTLFEAGMISPDLSAFYTISESFAFTTVSGEAEKPSAVLEAIYKHLAALSEGGMPTEDIERSRRVLYSEFVKDFDSTEEIANNMIDFIFDGSDLLCFGEYLNSVTKQEIDELLRNAFKSEYFSISVVKPK